MFLGLLLKLGEIKTVLGLGKIEVEEF